jgi:Flp pilus assembly protein TadD
VDIRLVEAFQIHQSGDLHRAEELYRGLLEDRTIALHVNQLLGALLLQKQQPLDAVPHLEIAAEGAPESVAILNNLAIAYLRSDRAMDAVAIYLRSTAIEPKNVETLKNLAEVFIKLNRFEEAANVLTKGLH